VGLGCVVFWLQSFISLVHRFSTRWKGLNALNDHSELIFQKYDTKSLKSNFFARILKTSVINYNTINYKEGNG
jgi:hypothetical protein